MIARRAAVAVPARIVLISLLFAPHVFSAVHGVFSGLSNMIGDSQAIIVASIESLPKTPRTHSGNSSAVQKVRVLYALKGDFKQQDQMEVGLDSEVLFPARTRLQGDDYSLHERYVLFIAKDSSSPEGYGIVNARGSAFWVPRESDLSVLEPGNVRGNLESLLRSLLKHSPSQALSACIQDYLSENPSRWRGRATGGCG